MRNPYYQGPVSDHFDGQRFFMAGHDCDKSTGDLLRWRRGVTARWPERFPSPFTHVPDRRVDGLRVVLVGHASFLLQVAGLNILIDPVWSERASPLPFAGPKRVNPPGVAWNDLPPTDAVLLTHNHYDHLDRRTLSKLWARGNPILIAPLGNAAIVSDIVPRTTSLDWGGRVALANGVEVHLRKALHWSARGLRDRRMALWGAYVLTTPAGVVYHVGDSAYGDGAHFSAVRREFGPPRVAILPIGAYAPRWFMQSQHMNPEEAVQAWQDCGAQQALGHHWGTFQLTDEPIDEPPAGLADALRTAGADPGHFLAMRPGQVWGASLS